jgi:hypothetical protein
MRPGGRKNRGDCFAVFGRASGGDSCGDEIVACGVNEREQGRPKGDPENWQEIRILGANSI